MKKLAKLSRSGLKHHPATHKDDQVVSKKATDLTHPAGLEPKFS